MHRRPLALPDLLFLCAPMPALILGVLAMRQIGERTASSMNLAACGVGLLLFAVLRYPASPAHRSAWYFATMCSVAFILATFAQDGLDGVHRWIVLGNFRLHASAVVAPVIIGCVATAPRRYLAIVIAAATAMILALQPDAAQTTSFAAGCGVILACDPKLGRRERIGSFLALIACSMVSIVRADPLKPVRHVEGIFGLVSARGPAWTLLAAIALILLSVPYFLAWTRRHDPLTLALGVYVAMITIAPTWGTFPVPIMGYGVSPILGYFIALAICARSASLVSTPLSPANSTTLTPLS
jgi:cell division protein FtsW (lipid II flippase)